MKTACMRRLIIPFFLSLLFAAPSFAEAPIDQVKQTTDKILDVLRNPALQSPEKAAERKKLVRQAVDERFDWRLMSRMTLARHWARLDEKQKEEFVSLFSDLLERTYLDQVQDYSGLEVTYEGEKVENDYASVSAKIRTKEGAQVPVVYRLKKEDGNWYVYDVIIEGVSLINNYRTQFNAILVNSSFSNLIDKLKAKLDKS